MEISKICEGVFRSQEKGEEVIQIEGKEYTRIMDFFYIGLPADELSPEQVSALCQARATETRCFGGANKTIKQLFNNFLKMVEYKTIFEIGAGVNPILKEVEAESQHINYIKSDADNKYQNLYHFDSSSDLPNDSLDIVIALFVLHFKFYEHQISQIYEHIKEDGIFLANIYYRSQVSRENLVADFIRTGFFVSVIEDPKNTCRDHFYIFASKNENVIENNKRKLLDLIQES